MKKLIMIMLPVLLAGCRQNQFVDVLFRTTDDPFLDIPVVASLVKE